MSEKVELVEIKDSNFSILNLVDISKEIEKKGNFNYLPWSSAHEIMKSYDPNAEVAEKWFEHYELISSPDGSFHQLITKKHPYQQTENSSYVVVSVTFKGEKETEIFPILDFRNQDVAKPSMSQVNKALKRGFVKALAKHGLGLYVYKGEDVPNIPPIDLKDLEKVEAALKAVNDLVGSDTTEVQINRANKVIAQDFAHLAIDKITTLESMNKDQYGILLRVINESKNKAEKNLKEQKKA